MLGADSKIVTSRFALRPSLLLGLCRSKRASLAGYRKSVLPSLSARSATLAAHLLIRASVLIYARFSLGNVEPAGGAWHRGLDEAKGPFLREGSCNVSGCFR
jgi:hypothetical protein